MLKIELEKKYPGHCIYLMSEESVQDEFLRIVENITKREEAFWDETSLKIMEVVDGARREGDYTIVTERGRGCMHSLSHECQAALILVYGQSRYRVPRRVRLAMFSTETLAWLNKLEFDVEILVSAENGGDWILPEQIKAVELLAEREQVEVDGQLIGPGITHWKDDLQAIANEIDSLYRGMEPEKVAKANMRYMKGRANRRVISKMKQELAMTDFLSIFGVEAPEYNHFHVVNTCRTLRSDGDARQRMLILLDNTGVHQYNISVGNFGDTLVNEILARCPVHEGKTIALITRCEPEYFRTDEYLNQAASGVMIDFDQAEIAVWNKYQAVSEFHNAYIERFGEWVEEDD